MNKKLAIFISTLVLSLSAFAETAMFCSDCSNADKAKAHAMTFANRLPCDPAFDKNIQCYSKNKIVTLVDENTGAAYKFNVFHEKQTPFNLSATPITLDSDVQQGFSILAEYRRDLSNVIRESSDFFTDIMSQSLNASSVRFAQVKNSSCPANTALAVLSTPNALAELRTIMTARIGTGLLSENNDINLNPRKSNSTFSFTYRGISLSITEGANSRTPGFVATFQESERRGIRSDALVFNVNIAGYDSAGLALTQFGLNNASRVAGFSLGALRGKHGPLLIDNECIEERLNEALATGAVTGTSAPIGGGDSSTNPTAIPSTGIPSTGGCQLLDFFQAGRRLYTFRICN